MSDNIYMEPGTCVRVIRDADPYHGMVGTVRHCWQGYENWWLATIMFAECSAIFRTESLEAVSKSGKV